jgi:protein O-mannosyl-transferase
MPANRNTWLLICVIMIIFFTAFGLISFSNSLRAWFLGDDWSLIADLALNGNPISTGAIPFFRPLGALSLFLDYQVWGLHAVGYHTVNILLHSTNALLIFWVTLTLAQIFSLTKRDKYIFSAFAGLLFLAGPTHAEPVSWISGRFDVLSVTWLLASFLAYLYFVERGKTFFLGLSLFFFGCAVFTKESVIIYPIIILLVHSYLLSMGTFGIKASNTTIALPLWFFLVDGIYLVARYVWLGALIGGYGAAVHADLRFPTLFFNLGVYAVKSLIPLDFIPAITRWIGDPYILVCSVATGAIVAALYGMGRPVFYLLGVSERASEPSPRAVRDMAVIIVAMFVISLVPVINLWPQLWNPQNDRFFYLPSVFAMMFVAILPQCFGKMVKVIGYTSIVLLAGIYSSLLHQNTMNWQEAGLISRSIVNNVGKLENTGTLFIVNLPDNINGAYIFRNSLERAIMLITGNRKFDHVVVVSFQGLTSPTETVTANCLHEKLRIDFGTARYGAQFGMGTFSLNGRVSSRNDPPGAVIPIRGSFETESWNISHLRPEGFDLRFTSLKPEDEVVYFSDGSLKKVDCAFYSKQEF